MEVRGGATAYAAVGVVVMTSGGVALITDHNLLVERRDLLRSAADAASAAAMIELNKLPDTLSDAEVRQRLTAIARKYAVLNAIGNAGRAGLTETNLRMTIDIDRATRTAEVSVDLDGGLTLMSQWLIGNTAPPSMTQTSGFESVRNPVEAVLAIDISESMKNNLGGTTASGDDLSRMDMVKQAAKELVDILDPDEQNRIALAVVPWHVLVRLNDTAHAGWVSNGWVEYPASRNYAAAYSCRPAGDCTATDADQTLPPAPEEGWMGCLDEHRILAGGHAALPQVADLLSPPSQTSFAQAIFPTLQGTAYECLQPPLPANFHFQSCYGEDTAEITMVLGGTDPQRGCASTRTNDPIPAILPLTTNGTEIKTAIDSLLPVGARTYSSLGILWGQRLLAHTWKDVWGGAVHPVDPDSDRNAGTRKAIVLLTDGEDNPCGLQDPTCTTNDVGIVRGVACTAVKAAGTEIFVVAAMHPDKISGSFGTALTACSSEAENPGGTYAFLENIDPAALRASFANIARQLKSVRRMY